MTEPVATDPPGPSGMEVAAWLYSLPVPRMGSYLEQARVTYTGRYVLPGETVLAGQTALPPDLEHAATEQVPFWFQNRERIGLARCWENQGTYRQFYGDLSLLPSVRKLLCKYRRWRL